MNFNHKISIITINKNNASGLEKTISSVIKQTYKNIEYIIVDGNSTDNSLNVIKKYSEYISVWISEEDKGIYDAMNKGLDLANGNYVIHLNSGDYLSDNKVIETLVSNITDDFDVIYGNIIIKDKNLMKQIKSTQHIHYNKTYQHNIPAQPVCFIKREVFSKYGGFDTSYKITADVVLIAKILSDRNIKYKYINIPITVFETNGISSNKNNQNIIFLERKRFLIENFPGYLSDFYKVYEKSFFKNFIYRVINLIKN